MDGLHINTLLLLTIHVFVLLDICAPYSTMENVTIAHILSLERILTSNKRRQGTRSLVMTLVRSCRKDSFEPRSSHGCDVDWLRSVDI